MREGERGFLCGRVAVLGASKMLAIASLRAPFWAILLKQKKVFVEKKRPFHFCLEE